MSNNNMYIPGEVGKNYGYNYNGVEDICMYLLESLDYLVGQNDTVAEFDNAVSTNGFDNELWDEVVENACKIFSNISDSQHGVTKTRAQQAADAVINGMSTVYLLDDLDRTGDLNRLPYEQQQRLFAAEEQWNKVLNSTVSRGRDNGRRYEPAARRGGTAGRGTLPQRDAGRYDRGGSSPALQRFSRSPGQAIGRAGNAVTSMAAGGGRGSRYRGSDNRGSVNRIVPDNHFDTHSSSAVPVQQPQRDRNSRTISRQEQPQTREAQNNMAVSRDIISPANAQSRNIVEAATDINNQNLNKNKAIYPGELRHKENGKDVLLISVEDANKANENKLVYPNLYCPGFSPITPGDHVPYYVLDENRNIVGLIKSDKEEEDMEKADHETARFFATWGPYSRTPDNEETKARIATLSTKAFIRSIEEEIKQKYQSDDKTDAELPEKVVDMERLHVLPKDVIASLNPETDDLVAAGRSLVTSNITDPAICKKYIRAAYGDEVIPTNYHAININNWTLKDAAADKANELVGVTNYSVIRRKLMELEPLVKASTLRIIDKIAADWVNETLTKRYGYPKNAINSYISAIEELLLFLEEDDKPTYDKFIQDAGGLTGTVLHPLSTNEPVVRKALNISEDAEDTNEVVFGKMCNVTLINIDSDKFSANVASNTDAYSFTFDSWPAMRNVANNLFSLCNPQVANVYIVTRDNRRMEISRTGNPKVFSIRAV